ncbi:MAG: radical SAM family heme chaperone HemW [Planctomycetes bacterium]|nr:radical SAM family heme chaperone HemW [Planctomycetota bacterium]
MTTSAEIRSLYVHVPFCHTLCGYCDFYSQVIDRRSVAPLVDALLLELQQLAAEHEIAIETLFVGGGTPTTLPPEELSRLLRALESLPRGEDTLEFTVEANPATVNSEIAGVLARHAVNRVSIGAQSFDPSELRVLERIHAPKQVVDTVAACRAAGIERINVDLIFGVPGQSLAAWESNLERVLELRTEHLSCYGLTYERGTPLFRQLQQGLVRRVDAEVEAEMYETTIDRLGAAGFGHYEISNFARPGRECRHNLRYWHNQTYAGIGPAAAGFVRGLRYKNVPDTAEYVRAIQAGRSPRIEHERLTLDRTARETAMLELRLIEGIDRRCFAERFGHDPMDLFRDAVAKHVELELLAVDEHALRLTRAGLLLADSVIADFL